MITPEQYDTLPDPLVALTQQLEDNTIRDICRRLVKDKRITATALIQTRAILEYNDALSLHDLIKAVSDVSGAMLDDVYELYQDALDRIFEDERYVYEYLGKASALGDDQVRQEILSAQALQTEHEFRNLTGSLGFLIDGQQWVPLAEAYQNTLDYAITQIQSGTFDPQFAIKRAVIRLTDSGLRTVEYASGHTDKADVAVRRAVVTGMHQLSGKAVEIQAKELNTSLFEVSAHSGARDKGDGFGNHKRWQGGVYWYQGPVEGYLSLVAETGYGDVRGLEGANCRHSKHIYVEGVSQRMYTAEYLRDIDRTDFLYEGKKYSAYEATQMQRKIERTMRFYKTRLNGLEAAGFGPDDVTYQQSASLLSKWRQKYTNFSHAAGLRTQPERAQVIGFGRGQAVRARNAARKAQ